MQAISSEKELLTDYIAARNKFDSLKEDLSQAQIELEKAEQRLIDELVNRQATSTAKYEGIGYVSLAKPRLYASYPKDMEAEIFAFVKSQGMEVIIKPSIHPSSLSSLIGQLIEEGKPIPQSITYYLKPSVKLYAK